MVGLNSFVIAFEAVVPMFIFSRHWNAGQENRGLIQKDENRKFNKNRFKGVLFGF